MKDLRGFNVDLKELSKRLKQLPFDVGVLAADEFDKNFECESFFGQKWKPSKYVKRTRSGGNLLQKTGSLRRSIQHSVAGENIVFTSNVPYAEIHNEGGTIKHPGGTAYLKKKVGKTIWISNRKALGKNYPRTKPHDIKIPQRQFIGEHKKLDNMIEREIDSILTKILK